MLGRQAVPPSKNADDPRGGLLDEETTPKTTADENAPPRSILAQWIDFMSDEEFAVFPGLTGDTAEQLDREEGEFVKTIQSNPKLFAAHLPEAVAKHASITHNSLAKTGRLSWTPTISPFR